MGVCPSCYGAGTRLDAGSATSRVTCTNCFGSGSKGNTGSSVGSPVDSLIGYLSMFAAIFTAMIMYYEDVGALYYVLACISTAVIVAIVLNIKPIRLLLEVIVFVISLGIGAVSLVFHLAVFLTIGTILFSMFS